MIDAIYFDGQSTRRQPVTLVLHKRIAVMRGAGLHLSVRLSQLRVSERLASAPRILYFPNGGALHVSDEKFASMLAANGYREPGVVRWQQNWLRSLAALVSLLAVLLGGYQWGLPIAADKLAQHLPATLEQKIGDQQLALIDARFMAPSKLDPVDQLRLRRLFSGLKQPRGEKTVYRLEFRHSRFGPNAFALPNGVIVMTDQLVTLAKSDAAVLAVLAHELGHLQRRHSLRRLLQALGMGVVVNIWIGDVSTALAAAPTFLLDQKYSRDFEREADLYAIDMMHANAMPLAPMADLFEKMRGSGQNDGLQQEHRRNTQATAPDQDDDQEADATERRRSNKRAGSKREGGELLEYFSSHPSDAERIARLRAADAGRMRQ